MTIEPYRIYNQEITITGSMAVLHSFERAAELFADGVLDPEVFISDRLPLDDYAEALDQFKRGHRPQDPGHPLGAAGTRSRAGPAARR